ncbi:Repressor of RNA polymerase III transcription MAF1 [Tetrabaena socialis]|uniref:Repressor of RNA polymerase III transcription n=1 Tax=Tetrabaena socialis TaxID=47790 RepID=A0A2J8A5L0_9CHLO|nr:Repressor of RNA polymerase III transcription MAF1 [Tetrabaena socialis]|eukprot:PNH07783.1 Repressor of RNA polymerase III transcription MAF1 [Tetrabaena socialis]
MKFLDLPPLQRLNAFLKSVDVGDYILQGDLEAYSCKLAGLDKKLSKSLDQEVQTGSSPLELSASPVGPLAESSSRKTLIYLILTLNHIYPDYDFSLLRAHHFQKEDTISKAEEAIDSHLLEVSKVWAKTPGLGESPFLECLWSSIDEAICLKECDVYCYKSDQETDPFGEQASMWSFNYFFYNRKMKRILYLSCRAISKQAADEEATESSSKYDRYNSDTDGDDESDRYGMASGMDV